jgi:hypothetical protein
MLGSGSLSAELYNATSGSADQKCDFLADLYNGKPDMNVWSGWYDNVAVRSAYVLLDICWGLTLESACSFLE